jgi:uncharacterized RDD family membrane protein YckC
MPNDARQFDTRVEIVTPENIAFQHEVAGPFRRLPAYLIDLVIRVAVVVLGAVALNLTFGTVGLGGVGMGLSLLLWFVMDWFYGGVFEACFNGQTPGKRLMHIRVVTVDGPPINALQAVLRNVLRAVDCQPGITCLVGLVSATLNDRFQRLGDLVCGTMVIVERRHWLRGVTPIYEPEAMRIAAQIPANFQISRSTARALAAYVQRRLAFSAPRRQEIAWHLGELLRERLQLPPETSRDLLLCGLYHRTFVTDRRHGAEEAEPTEATEPTEAGEAVPQSAGFPLARG